ncbi:type III secretion system chaperone [Ramlibacter rhizophilus]|uniref:type III secretion system chaperone n=1 Tax=Ramlibacter rhizophilus TaxID=1781167 RepID=UPI0014323DCC|nr:type III secretion system chaperone [Ramlibacter rhizophilus]
MGEEWLRRLGAELGGAALVPNAEGLCALTFEGVAITLNLHPHAGALTLRSVVGGLPEEGFEALALQLLAASLGPQGLAMDARGVVYLTRHLSGAASRQHPWHEVFTRFARQAAAWQRRLPQPWEH